MNSIIKVIDKFGFGYSPQELTEKGVVLGKDAVLFGVKYAVATAWYLGEKATKETRLQFTANLIDAAGVDRGGPVTDVTVTVGVDRCAVNVVAEGMPVSGAGKYKLVAKLKTKSGEVLAEGEYNFDVELIEQPKRPA
jgi:hypothetical protein